VEIASSPSQELKTGPVEKHKRTATISQNSRPSTHQDVCLDRKFENPREILQSFWEISTSHTGVELLEVYHIGNLLNFCAMVFVAIVKKF